jgi:CheY-like chemotaxis protein
MLEPNEWSVLIVEDQEDVVQLVTQIFQYHGSDVHVAHNGRECLEQLQTLRPHFVIMDLAMPVMDGWQALNAIRSQPEISDLLVVAFTAYHSHNVAEDARAAGFDAYYPKPLHAGSFVQDLQKLLG